MQSTTVRRSIERRTVSKKVIFERDTRAAWQDSRLRDLMRLEDEIRTRQFRSEQNKLTTNIIYTYNWLMTRNSKMFEKFGLTMQQYNILRIMRGQHPSTCTIQLLKDRMLDKQPDISRLLDRLHQKQLIERKPSSADRRRLDVLISQAGLDLLAEMDPEVMTLESGLDALTEEEFKEANRLLDRLRDST